MATSISFRPNDEDLRNLALLERSGMTRTEAIRSSLAESARRRRSDEALRAEAERLRGDPVDRRALEEVRDWFGTSLDDVEP